MRTTNCPSCGAAITFQAAVSVLAVCDYCRSTVVRHDLDVRNLGRMAELQADGSVLQRGAEGVYRGVHFAVIGRVQLRYPEGLWNEWHLLFDDQRTGWLGEAQGHYAVSFVTAVAEPVPPFESLRPGQEVTLDGRPYQVADRQRAVCVAGEGELPFQVGPGYEAPVADLTGPAPACATLDYSETPPLVFIGEYIEFDALRLTGLRAIDGW